MKVAIGKTVLEVDADYVRYGNRVLFARCNASGTHSLLIDGKWIQQPMVRKCNRLSPRGWEYIHDAL